MPSTDVLPPAALTDLARQIGPHVGGPTTERLFAASAAPELTESLAVCFVGADRVAAPPADLADLVRPSGVWHHQVRISAGATHFARSGQPGFTPDALELQQVVEGRVAAKLDAAIEWVDREVPDDAVVARLLVIPAYYVHALVLIDKSTYSAVLVDQPDRYRRLRYQKKYTLRAFLKALAGERPGGTLT